MAEVTINYKDVAIATMDASGTKTLQTQGKYCEDDIEVVYDRPSGGGNDTLGQWVENTLNSYENTSITLIPEYSMSGGGTNLDLLSFPNVTRIGGYAFSNTKAKRFLLPKLAALLGGQTFQSCTGVEKLALPAIADFGNGDYIFSGCTSLKEIDLGPLTSRLGRYYTFNGCSRLNTIVIRSSSVANVLAINVFNGTPFASSGTGGTLYVPQAAIADYQAATNWSTILGYANNSIQAIEGSVYENAYADGTPIT